MESFLLLKFVSGFVNFSKKLLIIHKKNTKKINLKYDSWILENLAYFLAHLLKE